MPRLLDLFCGAGGCSVGYHRAGFEVVGMDVAPQPNYPFPFVETDAVRMLRWLLDGNGFGMGCSPPWNVGKHWNLTDFDAIHASPPCQGYSQSRFTPGSKGREYPRLLGDVLDLLAATGKPWVVENVPGAPLDGIVLCGTMFGLGVRRHRLFSSSTFLFAPGESCRHRPDDLGVYAGKVTRLESRAAAYVASTGRTHYRPQLTTLEAGRAAMGIDWMDRKELSQAIPPAYTEFVGRQLLAAVGNGEE